MFQLPTKRGDNHDSLFYHCPTDWKEILQGLHFITVNYSEVRTSIGDAFTILRKLVSKTVCVSSRGFRIDRRNRLKGTLNFNVPKLSKPRLPIRIELEKIIISNDQQFLLEKQLPITELRTGMPDSVVIEIDLPETTNIPFGIKGKIEINYTHMWTRNSQDEYYISFLESPNCNESLTDAR